MDFGGAQQELESVLSTLELMLRNEKYSEVDIWLEENDPSQYTPSTVLAVLTITSYAKDKLINRILYLKRAEVSLIERLGKERAERLIEHRR